jgi:hypothetical protein
MKQLYRGKRMEVLRINGYVDEDGLNIGIKKLKKFKNKKVEVIILPLNEDTNEQSMSRFFNAIGKVDIDKNEIRSLREISKV